MTNSLYYLLTPKQLARKLEINLYTIVKLLTLEGWEMKIIGTGEHVRIKLTRWDLISLKVYLSIK